MTLEEWYPQEPWIGPPLPRFLKIYWPWYQPSQPPPGTGVTFRIQNPPGTVWCLYYGPYTPWVTFSSSWNVTPQTPVDQPLIFDPWNSANIYIKVVTFLPYYDHEDGIAYIFAPGQTYTWDCSVNAFVGNQPGRM